VTGDPFYLRMPCTEQYQSRRRTEKGEVNCMSGFFANDEGQGLVEYALIIAIIAIAVIVAMVFLRDQITNVFSNIGNNLT
jgi:pilus assembly protein Flp/PilA